MPAMYTTLAALVDVNNSLEVELSVYVCQIIIANSKLLWLLDKQNKKELIPQRYLIDRECVQIEKH